ILLDIMMPGIDGYEVCRRLKQNEETSHIPVIFITILEDKESLIEGYQAGGVDYITKPIYEKEVLIRVETHLKNSLLTRELMQKNRELQAEISKRERAEKAKQQAEEEREQVTEALEKADERLSMISQQEAERWGIDAFIGKSNTIKEILAEVRQLQSASRTSVLITGESGTGKELIALIYM
ncbi:MAG: response regulator, partial [Candidatus Poribacteria bacterium]